MDAILRDTPERCRRTVFVAEHGGPSGRNRAAQAAGEVDYLAFLSDDALPEPGWLDALLDALGGGPELAAAGARLVLPDGTVQHAGIAIGLDRWPHNLYAGLAGDHAAVSRKRTVSAVNGACLLIRRAAFDALDGFDPEFEDGYDDVDLCLRLGQQGGESHYCPASVVHRSQPTSRATDREARVGTGALRYEQRWRDQVSPDDFLRYAEDGLLAVAYRQQYPFRLELSPQLAVVPGSRTEWLELERLLAARSEQVIELIESAGSPRDGANDAPPAASGEPRLVTTGHEHRLGSAEPKRLVSILLPVKNGAGPLRELLPAVLAQSATARVEIVAIDSGSDDDTVELLQEFGATIYAIEPADFNHGRTRTLLAERARGEVLVFLSQWSRPVGDRWLAPLLASLDEDPETAGVCSRVLPYPDADLLTRRDGEREASGSADRRRKQIANWDQYRRLGVVERRELLNFHTVSAAIRASAFHAIPFEAVATIGEDLLWARAVLEAGWALIHEPASVVLHSHAYTLEETFARNVDDGIANRLINDRTLKRAELVPLIRTLAHDDWDYLRATAGLTGDELDAWQLEAALRRAAQVLGQWIGINHAALPESFAEQFSGVGQARSGAPAEPSESR
jgi:rhamnosyltransferase